MITQQRLLRLAPNPSRSLDIRTGVRGEIFYDDAEKTLRIYDGEKLGGHKLLLADFSNLDSTVETNNKATSHVTLGNTVLNLGGRTTKLEGLDQIQSFNFIGNTNGQHYGDVVGNVTGDITGTVTGNLNSGGLANISSIGFSIGVAVTEFSTDNTFADNSTAAVPVESAIKGYIDRRMGVTDTGTLLPLGDQIGPGFLPLDGGNVMTGSINLGDNDITNVGSINTTDLTVTNTISGTVTNGVVTTGSYANPSWITSLALSKVGFTASNSFTYNAGAATALTIKRSSAVLDFGTSPVSSKSFIISDVNVLATNAVSIIPLGSDEWEMDPISYSAQAFDGGVQIFASTTQGPVKGPRSVYYTLA